MTMPLETVRVPAGAFRKALADAVEVFALAARGVPQAALEEAVGQAVRAAMPTIIPANLDQLRAEGWCIMPPKARTKAIKRLKGGVDDTRQ